MITRTLFSFCLLRFGFLAITYTTMTTSIYSSTLWCIIHVQQQYTVVHYSCSTPPIRDRPKPVFLVSAIAESGAVTEVQLWP